MRKELTTSIGESEIVLVVIIGFVIYMTALYICLPVAILFSVIAFVQYLRMKNYKAFRNIAIAFFIPFVAVSLISLLLML